MPTYNTSDFSSLTQYLTELFNESAKRKYADWIGKTLFKTDTPERQQYVYQELEGAGNFRRSAEGAQAQKTTSTQGDSATWTQKRYDDRVSVTKDMRKFDLYNQMDGLVKTVTENAFNTIDQSMADLMLNGFSGTAFTDVYGDSQSNTAPDGIVLFSASHSFNNTASLARNLIRDENATANPALDRAAIVTARKDAKVHKDGNNVNRPITLDRLIVAPTNEDLAERIIMTQGDAGTANRDYNPLRSAVGSILVWPRLETSSQGTDTSAYWFMCDSSTVQDALHAPMTQLPMMTAPVQVHDSLNWEYVVDAYYVLGVGNPFGIWGSNAANA